MLKVISFRRNISISIFKSCPFFWWWNLFHFSDFTNVFVRKKKKRSYAQRSVRIKTVGEGGIYFIAGCFVNPYKMMINHFYLLLQYIYSTQLKVIIREVCSSQYCLYQLVATKQKYLQIKTIKYKRKMPKSI